MNTNTPNQGNNKNNGLNTAAHVASEVIAENNPQGKQALTPHLDNLATTGALGISNNQAHAVTYKSSALDGKLAENYPVVQQKGMAYFLAIAKFAGIIIAVVNTAMNEAWEFFDYVTDRATRNEGDNRFAYNPNHPAKTVIKKNGKKIVVKDQQSQIVAAFPMMTASGLMLFHINDNQVFVIDADRALAGEWNRWTLLGTSLESLHPLVSRELAPNTGMYFVTAKSTGKTMVMTIANQSVRFDPVEKIQSNKRAAHALGIVNNQIAISANGAHTKEVDVTFTPVPQTVASHIRQAAAARSQRS